MKRKILLILNMAIIGFSTAACSDDETNYITPEKKYPLTAFAVAINNVSANTTSSGIKSFLLIKHETFIIRIINGCKHFIH